LRWKQNKAKTEWRSGDYLIKQAEGTKREGKRKVIYHVYKDGVYHAYREDLNDAKATCIDN
jgi:hypothetical protein